MKICFDARVILNEKTGIGNYSFNLLRTLLEIDRDNLYIVLLHNKLKKNHQIYDLSYPNLIKEVVNIPPVSINQQYLLPLKLFKIKPDLYHYPNWDVPLFHPFKTIITIHDLTYLLHEKLYIKFYLAKKIYTRLNIYWGLKKSKKIIAVSEHTKKDILDLFGIKSDKIKVIYESCDESFKGIIFDKYRGDLFNELKIDSRYFLVVGERRPHKNLLRIIEAFNKFKTNFPDFKLIIVGKKYSNYNEPEELVNKLGLTRDVCFLGYVGTEMLIKLYVNAEAMLFLSIYEGFGIPILEAMSCETPLIISNLSAMPEIADGAAMTVNPFNVSEIIESMVKIVKEQEMVRQLIEKGKERVRHFSWETAAKLTLQLYERAFKD